MDDFLSRSEMEVYYGSKRVLVYGRLTLCLMNDIELH